MSSADFDARLTAESQLSRSGALTPSEFGLIPHAARREPRRRGRRGLKVAPRRPWGEWKTHFRGRRRQWRCLVDDQRRALESLHGNMKRLCFCFDALPTPNRRPLRLKTLQRARNVIFSFRIHERREAWARLFASTATLNGAFLRSGEGVYDSLRASMTRSHGVSIAGRVSNEISSLEIRIRRDRRSLRGMTT